MTSAHIPLPEVSVDLSILHLPDDFPRRHTLRPSRFLWGATAAFMAVGAGSVFHCVAAYAGLFHGCVAALTVTAALATAALGGERRRPVAFEIGQDGLTSWDRAGNAQ